jgi:hypothetical protein
MTIKQIKKNPKKANNLTLESIEEMSEFNSSELANEDSQVKEKSNKKSKIKGKMNKKAKKSVIDMMWEDPRNHMMVLANPSVISAP